MRVKRGVSTHKKHKSIKSKTKGMQHNRRSSIKMARQAVVRSLQYAYRDRRNRKRDFRRLWITRISAAAKLNDTTYSKLMNDLKVAEIAIDRKVLSELSTNYPNVFTALTKVTK